MKKQFSKWNYSKVFWVLCLCCNGLIHLNGAEAIDPNLKRAIDLYTGASGHMDEKAAGHALLQADQNDPLVKGWLARVLYMGPTMQKWGLTLNIDKVTKAATAALPDIRRRAEAGSAEALYLMGCAAKSGFGSQPNPPDSIKWFRRAAELGHVDALFFMGMAYFDRIHGVVEDKAETVKWLEKAASSNHVWAEAHLGYMYQSGDGVTPDGFRGITLIQQAALKGNPWGQYDFGEAYRTGQGVVQDLASAVVWFQKAAAQNYSRAQKSLAETETLVTKDALKKARAEMDGGQASESAPSPSLSAADASPESQLYHRESKPQMVPPTLTTSRRTGLMRQMLDRDMQDAAAGKPGAQMAVGIAYLNGDGVLPDISAGLGYLQKAARQGHPGAEYALGELYMTGRELQGLGAAFSPGVTQNVEEAILWYKKAAAKGHTTAQINLGYCYATGLGVPRDPAQAVEWFRKPAAYHSTAQFNLGLAYDEGEGVPKNLSEALNWYLKSATIGLPSAQNNVGYAYSVGRGVGKDAGEAIQWYRKAAAQSHGLACYNLGVAYKQGDGVPKDEAIAAEWYRKAAAQGFTVSNPAVLDAGMTFSGQFGLIFHGRWTIETVAGGYARDFEEFPAAQYPDREIANRRVKLVANAADALVLPGPTHLEYWTRQGIFLAYLISSSRIYGNATLHSATPTKYDMIDPNKNNARTSDDETLLVDNSLLERYRSLRERHQRWNIQDFHEHISKTDLQDLETFMRKWDSHSPAHRQLLANLAKFIQRAAP